MDILNHYSDERIQEFADEGYEGYRDHSQPIYCDDCGDERVDHKGQLCASCAFDAAPHPVVLPSGLYTEIMGVCVQVLDPQNENIKQWDVLACVRDLAQMAMAAKP